MNWMQVIAELGGGGAVLSTLLNLAQQYRMAHQDLARIRREENRKDVDQENAAILKKMAKLEASDLGAWVHRLIVVVSMFIISSTVWGPLLSMFSNKSIGVVWYWPTDWQFLLFSFEHL